MTTFPLINPATGKRVEFPLHSVRVALSNDKTTIFVPLQGENRRPIANGCQCDYCLANPHLVPCWDTLAVPANGVGFTYTVHNPQLKP